MNKWYQNRLFYLQLKYTRMTFTVQVVGGREIAIIAHIFIAGSNSVSFNKSMKSIISGKYFF